MIDACHSVTQPDTERCVLCCAAAFENIVQALYSNVVPKPKSECSKTEQLAVSFAAGYLAGILCATISHPADNLVSKLNASKVSLVIVHDHIHGYMHVACVQLCVQLAHRCIESYTHKGWARSSIGRASLPKTLHHQTSGDHVKHLCKHVRNGKVDTPLVHWTIVHTLTSPCCRKPQSGVW